MRLSHSPEQARAPIPLRQSVYIKPPYKNAGVHLRVLAAFQLIKHVTNPEQEDLSLTKIKTAKHLQKHPLYYVLNTFKIGQIIARTTSQYAPA